MTNSQVTKNRAHWNTSASTVVIIAGTGHLPISAITALRLSAIPFFVLSLFPEDNREALSAAIGDKQRLETLPFYKVSSIKKLLIKLGATHVLLSGKVDKKYLLSKISLDFEALSLLGSVLYKHDGSLMQRVVTLLEDDLGIQVIDQKEIFSSLTFPAGIVSGKPSDSLHKDIEVGLSVADQLSALDIGQTVVLKNTMILAVEAIEGTDACVKRGIEIGKSGVVVCKSACKKHNTQFDMPTLGPETIRHLNRGDVAAIAWRAEQTLILDKKRFIQLAEERDIVLIAV